MQRCRLRIIAAVVLVFISVVTMATPADTPIPEVPPEIPTPLVTFTFTGMIYNNPPAWTCRSQIVNTCLICTNTSADVSIVQVISPVMGGYEWLPFTIPIGAEVRSCGNIIFMPVFPD